MVDENLKISIIIPVYNSEKFLQECLKTVTGQSLKELEIICIDDGSTDNSLKILEDFAKKDNRIKILKSSQAGPSIARNLGLEQARGEFIGFVDSDDRIDLDFYEKLYNAAKENDAEIACASILKTYTNKNKFFIKYTKKEVADEIYEKLSLAKMRTHNYIWNKIYKHSALATSNIKFPEGLYFEDIVYTTKILYALKRLITVPDIKYYYRNNPLSIVNRATKKKREDYKTAIEMVKEFAEDKGFCLPENLTMKNWTKYKFFGIQILKIKEWDYQKKYYLLGFIPFLTEEKNNYGS